MDHFGHGRQFDELLFSQYDSDDLSLMNDFDYYNDLEIPTNEWRDFRQDLLNALMSTFTFCVKPTVTQTFIKLYPIIAGVIFLQIVNKNANLSRKWINVLNVVTSIALLFNFFDSYLVIYLSFLIIPIYFLLYAFYASKITDSYLKPLAITVCSIHLLIGGAEMIAIMKSLSLLFDLSKVNPRNNEDKHEKPLRLDFLDFSSYVLSINTSIFGPWVGYKQHVSGLEKKTKTENRTHFMLTLKFAAFAVFSLIASNCLFSVLDDYIGENRITRMYFEAFSFRQSNYFVLYFSQFLCLLSTLGSFNSKKQFQVVDQLSIEMPRSLVHVVTSWNIPMHKWLKKYIFIEAKQHLGTLIAILATYFVSSALHGFDVNIILVLFSIGLFAHIENAFRYKLSKLANSCVGARECRLTDDFSCTHKFKQNHILCKCINFSFTILNIYHLAYLGQIFHFESDQIDKSGLAVALSKWSKTHYSSHLIMLFLFSISRFLKT